MSSRIYESSLSSLSRTALQTPLAAVLTSLQSLDPTVSDQNIASENIKDGFNWLFGNNSFLSDLGLNNNTVFSALSATLLYRLLVTRLDDPDYPFRIATSALLNDSSFMAHIVECGSPMKRCISRQSCINCAEKRRLSYVPILLC